LAANNLGPRVTLAVRPGQANVAELVAAGAEACRYSPFGVRVSGNPTELPAVREGRAGVQDEGSQLAAWALSRPNAPAGWWLDLCAGPGGKAALLAGLGDADGSRLLAADIKLHRAALVVHALRGSPEAFVVIADGTRPPWAASRFSRVLVDAPCTGLGALRRRPEARWRRSERELDELHSLQVRLLHSALDGVGIGGVAGYVTCSPHRRETSDVVEEVLRDRPGIEVLDAAKVLPDVPAASRGLYLQLWPHRHGTDAMFGAYLRRHL
jgi:16S rRNA (cytosine967-C5)-methyltransferase